METAGLHGVTPLVGRPSGERLVEAIERHWAAEAPTTRPPLPRLAIASEKREPRLYRAAMPRLSVSRLRAEVAERHLAGVVRSPARPLPRHDRGHRRPEMARRIRSRASLRRARRGRRGAPTRHARGRSRQAPARTSRHPPRPALRPSARSRRRPSCLDAPQPRLTSPSRPRPGRCAADAAARVASSTGRASPRPGNASAGGSARPRRRRDALAGGGLALATRARNPPRVGVRSPPASLAARLVLLWLRWGGRSGPGDWSRRTGSATLPSSRP